MQLPRIRLRGAKILDERLAKGSTLNVGYRAVHGRRVQRPVQLANRICDLGTAGATALPPPFGLRSGPPMGAWLATGDRVRGVVGEIWCLPETT